MGKLLSAIYDHIGIIYSSGDAAGIRCGSIGEMNASASGTIFCTDYDYAIIIEPTGKRYCRNRAKTKLAGEVCRSMAVGEGEISGGTTDYPLN